MSDEHVPPPPAEEDVPPPPEEEEAPPPPPSLKDEWDSLSEIYFRYYDQDKDGKISVEEAERAIMSLTARQGGAVSAEEVSKQARQWVSSLDGNGDGYVERPEFQSYVDQNREDPDEVTEDDVAMLRSMIRNLPISTTAATDEKKAN